MHVYLCLHMFTRVYLCSPLLPMFTPLYSCLFMFTCFDQNLPVCSCFPMFETIFSFRFTYIYPCFFVFTYTRACLATFTPVYSCLPIFTRVYLLFTYVCLCLRVHVKLCLPCLPMFASAYRCMFTYFYPFLFLFTDVYS